MKFLQGLYIALWSLLLVIPGIVKTYSYAMTPYIMSEHPSLTANEAITESRRIMNGNKWRLFCLDFSFIGWELLCSLPLYAGGFLVLKYFTGSGYGDFAFSSADNSIEHWLLFCTPL